MIAKIAVGVLFVATSLLLVALVGNPIGTVVFFGLTVAAPILYLGVRGRLLEEPITFVAGSFLVFGVLSAWGIAIRGSNAWRDILNEGVVVMSIGLLLAYAAYFAPGRWAHELAKKLPRMSDVRSGFRTTSVILIFFAIGAIALARRFDAAGISSLGAAEGVPVALRPNTIEGATWTVPFLSMPSVGLLIWLAIIARNRRRYSMLLWFLAVVIYMIAFGMLGSRSRLLYVIVPGIVLYHFLARRLGRAFVVVGLVLTWGTYVWYGQIRGDVYSGGDLEGGVSLTREWFDDYTSTHGDVSPFRNTLDIIERYGERGDYLYGSTLVTPITNWIPRSIWPGKPASGAVVYTRAFFPEAAGMNITAVPGFGGELFMNFGYSGILFGLMLTGMFARVLKEYRESDRQKIFVNIIYAVGAFALGMIARGDVLFVVINMEMGLLFAIIGFWFGGGRVLKSEGLVYTSAN